MSLINAPVAEENRRMTARQNESLEVEHIVRLRPLEGTQESRGLPLPLCRNDSDREFVEEGAPIHIALRLRTVAQVTHDVAPAPG